MKFTVPEIFDSPAREFKAPERPAIEDDRIKTALRRINAVLEMTPALRPSYKWQTIMDCRRIIANVFAEPGERQFCEEAIEIIESCAYANVTRKTRPSNAERRIRRKEKREAQRVNR